jgi:hypothetical protein
MITRATLLLDEKVEDYYVVGFKVGERAYAKRGTVHADVTVFQGRHREILTRHGEVLTASESGL